MRQGCGVGNNDNESESTSKSAEEEEKKNNYNHEPTLFNFGLVWGGFFLERKSRMEEE
jgi:hypothetical protein